MKIVRSTAISLFVVVLALFGVPSASGAPSSGLPPQPAHLLAATYEGGLFHTIRYGNGSWTVFGDVASQTGTVGYVTDVAGVGTSSAGNWDQLQILVAND